MQVIAVRSEVVVDDIDEDHQAERVRRVDQLLEFIRRAVGRVRRIRQHPVVAPVARTREVIEWHQVDSGDAALDERRQTLDRKSVVSGRSVSLRVDLGCRRIIQKKSKYRYK